MDKVMLNVRGKQLIRQISYSRTINLGNYQSEKYDVAADVEPGVSPTAISFILRAFVMDRAGSTELARSYLAAAYEAQGTFAAPQDCAAVSPDVLINDAREELGWNG